MQGRQRTMNSIPDLAKKTSINSLLNPEASSDAFNSQIPNLTASLNTHQVQPHAQQLDAYGPSYVTPPSFNLRAASWGGPDDRRKPENASRHYNHQGMSSYSEQATPRVVRPRDDVGSYPLDANMWQAQHEGNYSAPAITPMYSDERTALSGDYPPNNYSQSYHAWQVSERASARIVARGTAEGEQRNSSSYYQSSPGMYHAPYSQDPPQQQLPRVVQPPPKRRPSDEEVLPPRAKRVKTAAAKTTSDGDITGTSKRGYRAKKRSEAAQIAAQNAKTMPQVSYTTKPGEKGKQKATDGVSMQIVPSGPGDEATVLQAELQTTRCMSTKYKSDTFPRCVACTRRWAGDTCRFQGIRYFLRNPQMEIVGVSFSESQKADLPSMKFPKEWNEELTTANIIRTKKTIARALLPTLRTELEHLHLPEIFHRPREREVRATCDTCMTSLFSSSWLCRLCGREACAECFSTVSELTAEQPLADAAEQQILQARREKHAHSNPFFLQCTKRIEHRARDFSAMSRFCEKELSNAIKEMEELLKDEQDGTTTTTSSSQDGDAHSTLSSASQHTDGAGHLLRSPPPSIAPGAQLPEGYPPCTTTNPFIPVNLSATALSIPTLPIRRFANNALTQENFPRIWALGQPLVVTGLLEKFRIQWTPEYFISKYGQQGCLIIECQTDTNRRITVGEFFKEFGRYEGRTECWKLKDWPPSTDFKKAFPELYEDFSNAVPVPSYVRRDGVLNIASHFPADTVSPDLGPKMYNAMANGQGAGSKGTTRLHMDMADALNVMTYAAPMPDGAPGCAAWDIYRAEDSDKLRAFLAGMQAASSTSTSTSISTSSSSAVALSNNNSSSRERERERENGETGPGSGSGTRVGVNVNDPIHGQQFYLDEGMRAQLYDATGVRSYRFYQRPGEAVFIPAGCAHQLKLTLPRVFFVQVANLTDCIKVAVDFVSPENVERCERLTREFREQNQRKVWKEDVLQLRTMMWFAWLSCRVQEGYEGKEDSEEE
ncbi:hypothetical protein D9615_008080 [Tricholomella constricta]|uniref:JmjC domain-containing protein n=1 Tax=Tricholomella constricta TaxID=117010 RepID=A0A8H5GVP7_9AGAR|nr:hypothetical protein D9615_008080 [Tricholomella constricta]